VDLPASTINQDALQSLQLKIDGVSVSLMIPPEDTFNGRVLYCLPGGGMSAKYFDLGGEDKPSYSFARYCASKGSLVAAIDPVGVADSEGPEDSYDLFPDQIVDQYLQTVMTLRAGFLAGDLHDNLIKFNPQVEVGVAHSMGAALTMMAQAAKHPFDALLLLGFGTKGLPQMLGEDEEAVMSDREKIIEHLPQFARKRFANIQYPRIPDQHHEPSEATEVLKEAADVLLPLPAVLSMFPGNVAAEAAQIKCPIFIAVGDRDMTGPPHDLPNEYPLSSDVTLYVIKDCGHHGFVADTREAFFARMHSWINQLN